MTQQRDFLVRCSQRQVAGFLRKAIRFMPFDMFICVFQIFFLSLLMEVPALWPLVLLRISFSGAPAMSCRTRVAERHPSVPFSVGGCSLRGEGKDSLTSIFALTRVVFIFLEPEPPFRKAYMHLLQALSHTRICPVRTRVSCFGRSYHWATKEAPDEICFDL